MGWTDHEPYFSMIENGVEEILENNPGMNRSKAWSIAYQDLLESLYDRRKKAMDQ
jgi:hypothetical protein